MICRAIRCLTKAKDKKRASQQQIIYFKTKVIEGNEWAREAMAQFFSPLQDSTDLCSTTPNCSLWFKPPRWGKRNLGNGDGKGIECCQRISSIIKLEICGSNDIKCRTWQCKWSGSWRTYPTSKDYHKTLLSRETWWRLWLQSYTGWTSASVSFHSRNLHGDQFSC